MKTWKKIVKSYAFNIALVVGFTGFVLWLTLKDNYQEILAMIRGANVGWLLVIPALAILYQVIIGWILKRLTLLSNPKYKLSQGVVNAFVASFFHGVTPSASGGQFAQIYIFKKQGVRVSDSASILWMDFIIYQSTMVASVFILILLRFTYFYAHYSQFFLLVLVGFMINGAIIIGLWALVTFPKVYTWLSTKGILIGVKLHIVKDREKALANLDIQLERFASETKKLKGHRKTIILVILANFVRLFVYYIIPYFCALALNIPVDANLILDILALSSFVSMINCFIPIPGASGGTEATFILMFSTIFGSVGASSIMILWRFITYYFVMILGGLTFIYAKAKPDLVD
ncbi:lysylphosphatidylglycerol synthase transmembrane domain-containing protein [Anaerorhabdus furcosa]|uniref:Phosphatidylglycerol lysyltransferase n=1 Tax=Anaerorhabdus furcosa TaxID=118967 RepID=A0A1T4NBL9_9FIRM|nr:lysylphosphatidylglycerol synthase transmembrane domain-containing protein [Anaerorhabdus furcosa]SJZ76505.1 Lysylphosphatidylglycerol synthase TM region [Anaerorhabdus furcosa]